MASVTAITDSATGSVQITVNFPVPSWVPVHVVRIHPDGTEHEIVGSPVYVSNGWAVLYDNSAPMDVTLQYKAYTDEGIFAYDNFKRSNTDTWNNLFSGQTWATSGGAAADFDVNGDRGLMSITDVNVFRHARVDAGVTDMTVQATVNLTIGTVTGANVTHRIYGRSVDTSNYYYAIINYTTADLIEARIAKLVAGVQTVLAGPVTVFTGFGAGTQCAVKLRLDGTAIRLKAWAPETMLEPAVDTLVVADSDITAGTNAGLASRRDTGNTDGTVTVQWEDFILYTENSDAVTSTSLFLTANDDFNRTVAADWGSLTSGEDWTNTNGSAADFLVNGTKGVQVGAGAANVLRVSHAMVTSSPDMRVRVTVNLDTGAVAGADITGWILARLTDVNNYYLAQLEFDSATDGVVLRIGKRVAGTLTLFAGSTTILASGLTANQQFTVDLEVLGTTVRAKSWATLAAEPLDWQLTATDSALTTGTGIGLASRRETGNTNTDVQVQWDNLFVYEPGGIQASPDGWLKNPVMPTLDIRIDNCEVHSPDCLNSEQLVFFKALETEEYESASGVFPVVNATRPIVVSQVRKDLTTSLIVVSRRLEDITAIRTLLASGEVLTLSLPVVYGWGIETFGTDWVHVGTDSASRLGVDMRKPYRLWTLPLILVDPTLSYPTLQTGGNNIGVSGSTWGDLAAAGQTWGTHAATANTWLDTAQGDNY
jgi:hypothetical protein